MLVALTQTKQTTGVLDDGNKPWESLVEKEGGARNKGAPSPASSSLWENGGYPADDHYRGLTPPISPSQVRRKTSEEEGENQGEHGTIKRLWKRNMMIPSSPAMLRLVQNVCKRFPEYSVWYRMCV